MGKRRVFSGELKEAVDGFVGEGEGIADLEEELGGEVKLEAGEVAVKGGGWGVLLLVEDGANAEEVVAVDDGGGGGGGGGEGAMGEEIEEGFRGCYCSNFHVGD